jgi:hypothetical protein
MIEGIDKESISDLGVEVLEMFKDYSAYCRENFIPVEDIREHILGDHYKIARDFLEENPNPSSLSAKLGKEHAMHQLTLRSERARLGSTLNALRSRLRRELSTHVVWNYVTDKKGYNWGKCYGIALCRESLGEVIDRLRKRADDNYGLAAEMQETFDLL